jgi:NADPH-dependent 2,4-dienoyl-CoA reductase/sulfur reductase-like enzyme
MIESTDVAVVGAGPAGLAAASTAAARGLSVILVDAAPRPGGQFYRQTPPELAETPPRDRYAAGLLAGATQEGVRTLAGTDVWGIFPEGEGYLLCLYGPLTAPRRLIARKVILAPGAHDRPAPFPGWTLPGVMTAGAGLTLVKHQHILPGRRVLLSGTGPLQLALARCLIEAGAEVAAVLDCNRFPWAAWRRVPAAWGQWERLAEGWAAWRTMQRAGVRIRWGQTVHRAEGDGRVERVVIGPVGGADADSVPVVADAVCLGYGFVPAVQLSRQAGCEHRYHPRQRVYAPVRDAALQTTLPGLFVAGDGAGIAGKDVARLEGQLAALGVAHQLGRPVAAEEVERIERELARQRRFAALLDALFPFSLPPAALLTDDTVLCRCEEVTVGQVRQAVAEGATTVYGMSLL